MIVCKVGRSEPVEDIAPSAPKNVTKDVTRDQSGVGKFVSTFTSKWDATETKVFSMSVGQPGTYKFTLTQSNASKDG